MTPPFIVGALSRNLLCTEWNMWDGGLNPSTEGFGFLPIPRHRCCGYVSYGINIFGTHPRSLTCMFPEEKQISFMCLCFSIFCIICLDSGIFPESIDALDVPLDVRLKNTSFDVRF